MEKQGLCVRHGGKNTGFGKKAEAEIPVVFFSIFESVDKSPN